MRSKIPLSDRVEHDTQSGLHPCVDCGHPTGKPITAGSAEVPLAMCGRCGLVYRRQWKPGFNRDLYDYYRERQDWPEERVFPPINDRRLRGILGELAADVPGRRLLDVGCGTGALVRAASRTGWEPLGIDLSSSAIALAQRFDLPCHRIDFFDSLLDTERFDLIVMSELIEHVPRPTTFLERARELLPEGGAVYVTTPNFASLGRRILDADWRAIHPEHLSYFTPKTLRHASEHAGLRVQSIRTENLSIHAVRRLLGRGHQSDAESRLQTQEIRGVVHGSSLLRALKRVLNTVLTLYGLGETIKAVLRSSSSTRDV